MDTYITTILERETCGLHKAQKGYACWLLETSDGLTLSAVCNKRAKKAGFTGTPSGKSLRKF